MAGYLYGICKALLGKSPATVTGDANELASRAASLEMDLREKNEQIEQMKREYANLEAQRDRAVDGGGQEQLEKLFKKLAGPLSNIAVLLACAERGEEVAAGDLAQLFKSLDKQFAAVGLETIGRPGQPAAFDSSIHQRVSGGTVRTGTPVSIELPGYRLGQKVIQKAMVSAAKDEQEGR